MQTMTLTGNIGKPPELRYTQSGQPVLNFSIADNRKDKDGKDLDPVWWDVTVWAPMAEVYANVLEKGTYCTVTGRVSLRQWEKDGKAGAALQITADAVGWRERRDAASQGGSSAGTQPRAAQADSGLPTQRAPLQSERAGTVSDDDDPFGDQ